MCDCPLHWRRLLVAQRTCFGRGLEQVLYPEQSGRLARLRIRVCKPS